ncbi:MAG: hypothetical protein QOC86_2462 [Gaiellales bacterium]|nr:hypothetical protein [Gaiellales bacterium]
MEARLSALPPPPPQSDPTEELVRIERRRKAAVRQRRHGRLRFVLVLILLAAVGAGGFLLGQGLTQAPGPELTTSDRGLTRVTLTETVATRTITVVTGR